MSQVPQVQGSKRKVKLHEEMMGIEEYEGDLIDLVDLDFKDVDEEDDFIAHSIAEFMIDFTKSLQKGWYCSQCNRRRYLFFPSQDYANCNRKYLINYISIDLC